jgi:hypothetical protein
VFEVCILNSENVEISNNKSLCAIGCSLLHWVVFWNGHLLTDMISRELVSRNPLFQHLSWSDFCGNRNVNSKLIECVLKLCTLYTARVGVPVISFAYVIVFSVYCILSFIKGVESCTLFFCTFTVFRLFYRWAVCYICSFLLFVW